MFVINKLKKKFKKKVDNDFISFLKHGRNYLSADIFSQLLAFISIPIFTRLLVPEEYGLLAVFSSFIAIFVIISGLGIRGAVARYYYENTQDFEEYLGSNILFIFLWGMLISLMLIIFKNDMLAFFKLPPKAYYTGVATIFLSTSYAILISFLQASKQSKKIAKLEIFKNTSIFILSIILVILFSEDKYYGKIYTQLIIGIGYFCYSLFFIIKMAKINFHWKYVKYSLTFGIPLIFHGLSGFFLNSFDQVIINQLVGSTETGLYTFAYKIGMIQQIITLAMLRSWTPMFYQKLNEKAFRDIDNLAIKYINIIFCLGILLISFSKEAIVLVASEQYYLSLKIIPIIVIGYLFNFVYFIYVNYAFYAKKTYLISLFTALTGVINISLNYWLIPIYGYQVAAWTTLFSFFVFSIFHYINVKFIINFDRIISIKIFYVRFLYVGILAILIDTITDYFENSIGAVFIKLLVAFTFIAIIYKGSFFSKRKYKNELN